MASADSQSSQFIIFLFSFTTRSVVTEAAV